MTSLETDQVMYRLGECSMFDDSAVPSDCLFCGQKASSAEAGISHMATHLRDISIFALPPSSLDYEEDDEVGDPDITDGSSRGTSSSNRDTLPVNTEAPDDDMSSIDAVPNTVEAISTSNTNNELSRDVETSSRSRTEAGDEPTPKAEQASSTGDQSEQYPEASKQSFDEDPTPRIPMLDYERDDYGDYGDTEYSNSGGHGDESYSKLDGDYEQPSPFYDEDDETTYEETRYTYSGRYGQSKRLCLDILRKTNETGEAREYYETVNNIDSKYQVRRTTDFRPGRVRICFFRPQLTLPNFSRLLWCIGLSIAADERLRSVPDWMN